MSISVNCPGCGKSYAVDEGFAGRTMKCRNCQAAISVPNGGSGAGPIGLSTSGPSAPVFAPRPAARQRAPFTGGPRLPDNIAHMMSLGLIALAVASLSFANWNTGQKHFELKLPEDYNGAIYGAVVLSIVAAVVLSLTLGGLGVLTGMAIGAAVGREQLSSSPMLRAVGIASLPVSVAGLMMMNDMPPGMAILGALASLVVVPLLVKFVGDMKWVSTLVAGPIAAILIIGAFVVAGFLNRTLGKQYAALSGMDEKGLRAAFAKDPEKFRAARFGTGTASANPLAGPRSPTNSSPPAPPAVSADPLTAALDRVQADIRSAGMRFEFDTRPSLKAKLDQIAAALREVKPDTDATRERWASLDRELAGLFEKLSTALDDEPPARLFEPLAAKTKLVANDKAHLGESELQLFPGVRSGDPAKAKLDLHNFAWREQSYKWELPDRSSVEVKAIERRNPKQTRPWVDTRHGARMIGDRNSLLVVDAPAELVREVTSDAGVVWTVVAHRSDGFAPRTRYVYYTAMDKNWLVIEPDDFHLSAEAQSLAQALAASVRPASADGTNAPSPFEPARVVQRLSDDFQRASSVLRQLGAPALPAIDAFLARTDLSATLRQQTIALREEVARRGTRPDVPTPPAAGGPVADAGPGRSAGNGADRSPSVDAGKPADIDAAIELLNDKSASTFKKRDMLDALAKTPVDPKRQDLIAGMLEEMMLSRDWFGSHDHIAGALKTWWRPRKTVAALLPGLEYNARFGTSVEAIIGVVAETKEKEAVFPVVRWIIEKPDVVVTALKKMGPIAEDEVIKVLRQENADAKRNAVRILQEIGTRKSMGPLNAMAKDQRDRATAALAQVAYEDVKARVQNAASQPAAPASQPAKPAR